MVLPTKHISLKDSYLGAGMTVLKAINGPMTVTQLWNAVSTAPNITNSRRFYRVLDLLFMMGLIKFTHKKIERV